MKAAAVQNDDRRPQIVGLGVNAQKFAPVGFEPFDLAVEDDVDNLIGEALLAREVGAERVRGTECRQHREQRSGKKLKFRFHGADFNG